MPETLRKSTQFQKKSSFLGFNLKKRQEQTKMILKFEIDSVYQKAKMQIQPPDNLANAYTTQSSQEAQQRKIAPADAIVNELGDEFASVINRSIHQYQVDSSEKIQQAKQAIAEGRLDTPEAIESAVENLLSFGI
jgi:hypothetical protein